MNLRLQGERNRTHKDYGKRQERIQEDKRKYQEQN